MAYEPLKIIVRIYKKFSGIQKPSRLPNVPYHILSFHNVVNVYHDKRVSFSDEQYKARADFAVCHWNENVDREFTSVWKANYRMPRN